MPIADLLNEVIHERGPLTVAAFMDIALYHPVFGYYSSAVQRSGRAGDFFTSVDVGPLFGELLALQIADMAALLAAPGAEGTFDLVEAGAGNGRLAADLLRGLRDQHPLIYQRTRLHLVEASAQARSAQHATLGDLIDRLSSSSATLPDPFEGVLVANELLDAMPVHQVVMRTTGLREVFVAASREGLALCEGPPSTPRLEEYFQGLGIELEEGCRAEISLDAVEWVRQAARRLRRGFLLLIDYGHQARELYSAAHAGGTLTSYARHAASGPEASAPRWLGRPGEQDLTAHVDFTSVRRAAESEGCLTLGFMDQMYFLTALADQRLASLDVRQRRAFKTLATPGGLGSTMKVMVLGKGVGAPRLRGCSSHARLT